MKVVILLFLLSFFWSSSVAQVSEAGYSRRVATFSWMPDGKRLLLNVVKEDKNKKVRPAFKKFLFNIEQQTFEEFPLNGSGLAVHPDGKSVVYIETKEDKTAIHFYNFFSKKDVVLIEDTIRMFAVNWAPDGNRFVYNIEFKKAGKSALEICTYDLLTKTVKQITNSFPYYSYNPMWNPVKDEIVYFLEKGDHHDQIYLTDFSGSFNKNITNDSTTHNYYPSWIDQNVLLYSKSPDNIMVLDLREGKPQQITGASATVAKYNAISGKIAYMNEEIGKVYLYDYKRKSHQLAIDEVKLGKLSF
jgi:Tol biopolymer transport system component